MKVRKHLNETLFNPNSFVIKFRPDPEVKKLLIDWSNKFNLWSLDDIQNLEKVSDARNMQLIRLADKYEAIDKEMLKQAEDIQYIFTGRKKR